MYKFDTGTTWSECNRKDFKALYQSNKDHWCMGDITQGKYIVFISYKKYLHKYFEYRSRIVCIVQLTFSISVLALNEKLKVNWKF